jgi:hypothetical protein
MRLTAERCLAKHVYFPDLVSTDFTLSRSIGRWANIGRTP